MSQVNQQGDTVQVPSSWVDAGGCEKRTNYETNSNAKPVKNTTTNNALPV